MSALKKLRRELFKIVYAGKSCFCPYCEKTYSKFMHEGVRAKVFKTYRVAGGGYKKNVKCPYCDSTDRGRLLYLFFKLRTNVFSQKTKILHISPNANVAYLLKSQPTITYVCGALFPEEFQAFNAVKVDVTNIDFANDSFDIVICNHVLEHVPNDTIAMKEIFRVVKPQGFAILQVPLALNLQKTLEDTSLTTNKQRKIAYGQTDHLRLYGLDYFNKLQKAGFRIERDNPFDNAWTSDLGRYRLDKNEDVIIARKD